MSKVKRPLAVVGFTFFITGGIVLSLPTGRTLALLAVFALLTFIHFITKKKFTKHLLTALITAAIAIVYVNIFKYFYIQSVNSIPKENQNFIGYVSSVDNNSSTYYTVTLLNEQHREIYNVSIYYNGRLSLADVVEINGKFKPAKNDKYIFSKYSDNIKGSIQIRDLSVKKIKINTVKYNTLTLKNKLLCRINDIYPEGYSAVVSAMGYNDAHELAKGTKQLFKNAGLGHALVVSGLHIGIIILALQGAVIRLPIDKKLKNTLISIVILCFMFIIGMSPSIIRAGVIGCIVLLCHNFKLEQDSITTLALVGMICAVLNPFISRDIGAMLSYSATVGIIIADEYCKNKGINGTKHALICCSAANIFILPITAIANIKINILAPIFNVLLSPLVAMICVLSVLTPILAVVPGLSVINSVLVIANKVSIYSLTNILSFINKNSEFAIVRFSDKVFVVVFAVTMLAYLVAKIQMFSKKTLRILVFSVSIFTFICYNLLNYNIMTVTAFDSGYEASFHIYARGREYLVLSEDISTYEAENMLMSPNMSDYKTVYYCPKEFKVDIDMSTIAAETVEVDTTHTFAEEAFELKSVITDKGKLFTISAAGCDISFGHGKVTSKSNYYFLGNDKPEHIEADEIYIFGNTPKWMNVENINNINSDLQIKINLKTGECKTVKDVLNFGYRV